MTAPGGGAVAVWAASGLSYNRSARAVDAALYAALFEGGHRVLGDAVREAQRAYAGTGEPRYLLDIYNLLGDPETALR